MNPGLPPCRRLLYQLSHKGITLNGGCTPCGQSAGSSQCPPPCAASAGPHASIQVLHDAQHLHTEVSHLCWAQRAAPLRGWACTEDAQLRATSATVKSTVLVLLGLRHCFWEQGPQGQWSRGAQSPGRDCGLGRGGVPAESSLTLLQAVPGWKLPVGSTPRFHDTQAGPLDMRIH